MATSRKYGFQQYSYRFCLVCLACVTLTGVFCSDLRAAPPAANQPARAEKSIELFNTMEFRGSLKALTAWKQVIVQAQQQLKQYNQCATTPTACDAAARSWLQMLEAARELSPPDQLKWVNRFFNRWPYRLDLETYGLRDYWATPQEFMEYSGDCEDYSISKYYAFRQLGYPAASLRIVILKDAIRNLGHAVLAVYQGEQIYILDNVSDLVLDQDRYSHYLPQYSVNEEFRWAHIRKFKGFSAISQPLKGPAHAKQ